ncbi:ROK family protein, partial [Amycolatopsis mediterranei]
VGHIAVDPSGERCPCGRTGCLETKANLAAVLRAAAGPGDPLHDPAPGVEGRVALLKDRIRLPAGGDGGPRTRRGVRARPACPLRGAAHLAAPLPAQAAPSAGEVCA